MAFKFAVALTGGIGTGKSSAVSLFKLQGFRVIDADSIAHETLQNEAEEIEKLFGKEFLIDGVVDRKALGKLIFSDKKSKKELENLLHPKIFNRIEAESVRLDQFRFPYIIDIPLFFERGIYPVENSIVIYAPRELQIQRVIKRDSLSEDETIQRVDSQIDIEKKRESGTFIVDNSSSLKNLQKEIERVSKLIKAINFTGDKQ
jgi:dephospho-CoA kinase